MIWKQYSQLEVDLRELKMHYDLWRYVQMLFRSFVRLFITQG
jgi:hypothetical protein